MIDALALMARLSLDKSDYDKGLDEASKSAGNFGSTAKNIGKAAVAAFATASAAVGTFAMSSLNVGEQFDKAMSQVVATMGYSVEDLNTEGSEAQQTLETLRNFAQEMGSTTVFSATQSADALNYMALAGYDAETSMKMLPNVLNLAAAGGIDLAYASDMVTDAQTALGLSLDETSVMVDQMARTASRSNTSVSQLGDAILTVGGTAQFMTGGTEELNAVLGVLADNGIKGSEAGTHLRNMLLKLSAPTDDGAMALENLGVKIFDAEGNMRSFADFFPELQQSMSKLTDEEQLQALSLIFNTRDIAAAQALMKTSVDRWDELGSSIRDAAGAAEAMSGVQLGNLSGDITLFKSALEGLQIAVSDSMAPMARQFVQFGSTAVASLSEGFKEGGIDGAMEALGTIISNGITMLTTGEVLTTIINAGLKLVMALVTGILQSAPQILQAGIDAVIIFIQGLTQTLPQLIPTIIEAVLLVVETLIDNAPMLIEAGLELVLQLINGIIGAIPQLLAEMPKLIDKVLQALIDALPVIIEAGLELIPMIITGILDALPTLLALMPVIVTRVLTTLIKNIPKLIEAGIEMIPQIIEGLIQAIPSLLAMIPEFILQILGALVSAAVELVEAGRELVERVKEGFRQKIEDAKEWGKDLIQNFKDGIMQKWEALKNGVKNIANGIKNILGFSEPKEGPLSNFHTYAPDMMELFAKGIRDNEDVVYNQLKKSFDFDDFMSTGNVGVVPSGGVHLSQQSEQSQPLKIIVQSVLNGRVIGETAYDYINGRMKAGELA